MTDTEHDPVNRPAHYIGNGLEAIDVIEDWQLGFHLGNAVKYILRAGRKGDRRQDLEKALWYVRRAKRKRQSNALGRIRVERICDAFHLDRAEQCALAAVLEASSDWWLREDRLAAAEGYLLGAIERLDAADAVDGEAIERVWLERLRETADEDSAAEVRFLKELAQEGDAPPPEHAAATRVRTES